MSAQIIWLRGGGAGGTLGVRIYNERQKFLVFALKTNWQGFWASVEMMIILYLTNDHDNNGGLSSFSAGLK